MNWWRRHRASRIIPEIKFENQFGYIRGEVAKLTERGDGYQLEFDGSGLDLICRLPASTRATLQGLAIGDTFVVFGRVEMDGNLFTDDDLVIEACNVAPVVNGAYGVADVDTHAQTHGHLNPQAHGDRHPHTHIDTQAHINTHADIDAYPWSDLDAQAHVYPQADGCRWAQLHRRAGGSQRTCGSRNELPRRWQGHPGPDIYAGRAQSGW